MTEKKVILIDLVLVTIDQEPEMFKYFPNFEILSMDFFFRVWQNKFSRNCWIKPKIQNDSLLFLSTNNLQYGPTKTCHTKKICHTIRRTEKKHAIPKCEIYCMPFFVNLVDFYRMFWDINMFVIFLFIVCSGT